METPNINLIDSHFHTALISEKGISLKDLNTELSFINFSGGIDIGTKANDIKYRKALLKNFSGILFSSGLYPSCAESQDMMILLQKLEQDLIEFKPDALGEIGLDWYWKYATKEKQIELFKNQLKLANTYNLPVIIHNREADDAIISILSSYNMKNSGIFHCFSSNIKTAKKILDLGFFISFSGNITFKSNDLLRDVLKYIPIERLLLETDSPYLSPVPKRGKINTPLNMKYIYKTAAEIRNIHIEKLANSLENNFTKLFPHWKKN